MAGNTAGIGQEPGIVGQRMEHKGLQQLPPESITGHGGGLDPGALMEDGPPTLGKAGEPAEARGTAAAERIPSFGRSLALLRCPTRTCPAGRHPDPERVPRWGMPLGGPCPAPGFHPWTQAGLSLASGGPLRICRRPDAEVPRTQPMPQCPAWGAFRGRGQ